MFWKLLTAFIVGVVDGPVYVSLVDNNVWEPGVYGWEEV